MHFGEEGLELEESEELSNIIQKAFGSALERHFEFLTPEWVLYEALESKTVWSIFAPCDCDIEGIRHDLGLYVTKNVPVLTESENDIPTVPEVTFVLNQIYQNAELIAASADRKIFDVADMILAMLDTKKSYTSVILTKRGVNRLELLESITAHRRMIESGMHFMDDLEEMNSAMQDDDDFENPDFMDDDDFEFDNVNYIEKYTTNLTEKAKDKTFGLLIGREEELERTIHILCRLTKNNPIHVGDAGVGKTALAYGLARRIVDGAVPSKLADYKIYSLDLSNVLAGTKFRGDFENRMTKIIQALKKEEKAILYIDEIHTIVGAGAGSSGNIDAASILKPILTEGQIRVMGATTYEEYSKIFEKNRALSRRFQKVDVTEPSKEDAIRILQGISNRYEEFHKVRYPKKSLEAAVALSIQYLPDRRLPDKAIDIIDEAGVTLSLTNEKLPEKSKKRVTSVNENLIKSVTAKMAHIPIENVTKDEKILLKNLEETLRSQIFGQDEAVKKLCTAVKKARAGFRNPDKPEASFLFVGPTGVGKTELTRVLGDTLSEKILRFDMSEYQEAYTVSRLIGSAPGYVGFENGGLLTESVRQNPHSIILFDEIEKAHEDIFNILLQVLDYGTLTGNQGRKSDFRNCMIILTSNAGARDMEKPLVGFDSGNTNQNGEATLKEAVNKTFSPEFRNRLDAIIPFAHLDEKITQNIAQKAIQKIGERLKNKNVELEFDDSVSALISAKGYSREFGARNISRTAEELIATPLVDELLFGKLCDGGKVRLFVEKQEISFDFAAPKK